MDLRSLQASFHSIRASYTRQTNQLNQMEDKIVYISDVGALANEWVVIKRTAYRVSEHPNPHGKPRQLIAPN